MMQDETEDAEQIVWEGCASQRVNTPAYIVLAILSVVTVGFGLILAIPVALLQYLNVKNTRYTVTTQRIKVESGALFVTRDQLELHRIRDYTVQEPAYLRRHGVGIITLNTTDKSHPVLLIRGVPDVNALLDKIRTCVRQERQRYRGIDVE